MSVVSKRTLFISSANRQSGSSSDFTIPLLKPITIGNPNNWLTVHVGTAEIPYVFKLINSSNNTITFTFVRGTTYNGTCILTPGNYNILTLLQELKTKLSTAIQTASGFNPSQILNFTYDRSTGFATFSMVGTDSTATSLTLNGSTVFLKCVGMTQAFTFSYTTPSARIDATSTQNVNVSQNTAIYIRSESLSQSNNQEAVISRAEPSDIIGKVQVNVLPQAMIEWVNYSGLEIELTNKIVDVIHLYLGDSNSYTLDLQNLDWTCRITFTEWSRTNSKTNSTDDQPNSITPAQMTHMNDLLQKREAVMNQLVKLKGKIKPPKENKKHN
jgi:hypothetical protein